MRKNALTVIKETRDTRAGSNTFWGPFVYGTTNLTDCIETTASTWPMTTHGSVGLRICSAEIQGEYRKESGEWKEEGRELGGGEWGWRDGESKEMER